MGVKGLKECGNLGNFDEAARHTLASEMLLPIVITNKRKSVRAKIYAFGLPPLPGIKLTHLCTVAWVICHGTKFKSAGIMICNVHKDWSWSVFGERCQLWTFSDYVYFAYVQLLILYFSRRFQGLACEISGRWR